MNELIRAPQLSRLETVVEPDPEALFAAHIEAIRQNGDALDARKDLQFKAVGRMTLLCSCLNGTTMMQGEKPSILGLAVPGAIAGAAAVIGTIQQRRRSESLAMDRKGFGAQQATGIVYDLYRDKEGNVLLHWLGPSDQNPDSETAVYSLVRTVRLAEKHGVSGIILDGDTLNRAGLAQGGKTLPGKSAKADVWIKKQKGLAVSFPEPRNSIQLATPEQWDEFIKALPPQERTFQPGLHAIVEKLRDIDSVHPLVGLYDQWKNDDLLVRTKIKSAVSSQLKMDLSTVVLSANSLKELDSQPAKTPLRQKLNADAYLHGLGVHYTVGGAPLGSRPLAVVLGIDESRIDEILANHKQNPAAAKQLLLYLAYKECVSTDQHIQKKQEQGLAFVADVGFQHRIVKEPDKYAKKNNRRLLVARMLGTIAGLVLNVAANGYIDVRYEQAGHAAARAVAVDQGLDPELAHVEQKDIDAKLLEWSRLNGVWKSWRDARKAIIDTLDFAPAAGIENTLDGLSDYTEVGNVKLDKDKAIWRISEVSGMDTAGYWWEDTSTKLQTIPAAEEAKGNRLYWDLSLTPDELGDLQPLSSQKPKSSYIEVERSLHTNGLNIGSAKPSPYDGFRFIGVPIREGTVLSGATLDGQPVQMALRRNGLPVIAIATDANISGHLKYWITPVPKDSLPAPRIDATDTPSYQGMITGRDAFGIMQAWEKWKPGINSLSPQERFDAMRSHIASMEYEYDPLDPDAPLSPPSSFVNEVLKEDEANCNVAATALWLSDTRDMPPKGGPRQEIGSRRLGAVVGFVNGPGKGRQVLSSKEKHMALVDAFGQIIDATPSRNAIEEDQEPINTPRILEPWMIIPGVIAIGAIGYLRRRQIMGATQRIKDSAIDWRSRRAIGALRDMDSTSLQLALDLAGSYLYGGQQMLDVDSSYIRTAKYPNTDKNQLIDTLAQPHYTNRSIQRALLANRQIPPTARRAYRLATRVKKHR